MAYMKHILQKDFFEEIIFKNIKIFGENFNRKEWNIILEK